MAIKRGTQQDYKSERGMKYDMPPSENQPAQAWAGTIDMIETHCDIFLDFKIEKKNHC